MNKKEIILKLIISLNQGGLSYDLSVRNAIWQYDRLVELGIITESQEVE